ncbi:MAG TPA: FMN-binding protein [Terriglobales bacterium]|jgi:uncharacterized protein with FMN-binding domain
MALGDDLKLKKKSGGRPRHGIVALSSAAVLAVYSAGYVRSRDAARRFNEQDAARIHAVPLSRLQPVLVPATPPALLRPAALPVALAPPASAPSSEPNLAAPSAAAKAASAAAATPRLALTGEAPAPEAQPAPAAEPTPAVTAAASIAGSLETPRAERASAPVAPAQPAAPKYNDGTYTGWGTSRHGDIQAQVEIANGKIASARIISCLTRYSCSWIEALPGQVVSRQSANVDYVSGATQSTDAFYYAIVQALGKAH